MKWHLKPLYKLKHHLTALYFLIIKSYLNECFSQVSLHLRLSSNWVSNSPKTIPALLLYLLYTADIHKTDNTIMATFADGTTLLVTLDTHMASELLKIISIFLKIQCSTWRWKDNQTKSVQVTFMSHNTECPMVIIRGVPLSVKYEIKYLGLTSNNKCESHIRAKHFQIKFKLQQLYWLLGRRSKITHMNKILIYKTVIRPTWNNGVQL